MSERYIFQFINIDGIQLKTGYCAVCHVNGNRVLNIIGRHILIQDLLDPLHDFCTLVLIGFALIICKQLIHFFIGIIEVVLTAVRLITCQEHIRVQTPRVPYREKIRKTVSKQGRHKKQTGGSGQFGDVWVRFEPNFDEEEMVFAEEVFGGSVPKNFFPAVEKGLREACVHGPLAGYPVVNLKAVLYDGSYHPVDSSEIAFKTAAQLAYKAAMPEANPVLLEPVGELKVTVPDSYMGDVIGDLNKRRGRVMGMTPTADGEQIIEAEVPMAEMTSYAIDLRAMTQSRGSFVFHFVRYEDCPPAAQAKAIEAAKAMAEE